MPDQLPSQRGHRWFAWFYDRMSTSMERGPLGRMRASVLDGVSGDVLEIGAGGGANFPHYPPSARVQAYEPDPHMLRLLRERAPAHVAVAAAFAEQLPAAGASIDVVVSTLVLCTVTDPQRALAEIRRVLRPGGELRFIEHVRGTGRLGTMQDAVQPVYGWFAAGCHANRRTEQTLLDAGFTFRSIEHRKISPPMPAIAGIAVADGV